MAFCYAGLMQELCVLVHVCPDICLYQYQKYVVATFINEWFNDLLIT